MKLGLGAAGLLLVTLAGCVSQGKYDQAVADAQSVRTALDAEKKESAKQRAAVADLEARLADAEARAKERDEALTRSTAESGELKQRLDDTVAMNGQLRGELTRLGKDADKLLAEKGAMSQALAATKARLEELRRAQAAAEARAALFHQLASKLKRMVDAGDLSIVIRDGRMVLRLPNEVLFDTGKTDIKPAGKEALRSIADVMKTIPDREFQIAGHTDDVPIATARFPSNWELSTGRALAVVHLLIDAGVDPAKLSAAGYGEMDPVAANDTADGRQRNRRTEITLQTKVEELVAVPPNR